MKHALAGIALVLVFGGGCRATGETPDPPPETDTEAVAVACEDPRPERCGREYRPVCGQRDTGVRCVTTPCNSMEPRTYRSACAACADPKVLWYVPGACAKE